jgi:hypothetical protein
MVYMQGHCLVRICVSVVKVYVGDLIMEANLNPKPKP